MTARTDATALRGVLNMIETAKTPDARLDAWLVWATVAPDGAEVVTGPISGETRIRVGKGAFTGADVIWEEWPRWRDARPTASLDAAVALVERVLPGWSILMAWNGQRSIANVHIAPLGTYQQWARSGEASTPSLALCTALVRALIADHERQRDGRGDGSETQTTGETDDCRG